MSEFRGGVRELAQRLGVDEPTASAVVRFLSQKERITLVDKIRTGGVGKPRPIYLFPADVIDFLAFSPAPVAILAPATPVIAPAVVATPAVLSEATVIVPAVVEMPTVVDTVPVVVETPAVASLPPFPSEFLPQVETPAPTAEAA